jgi:hypothetical protein
MNTSNDHVGREGTCNSLRILLSFALQPPHWQQHTEHENCQSLSCSPREVSILVSRHPILLSAMFLALTERASMSPVPMSTGVMAFSFLALLQCDWIGCEAG